MLVGCKRYALQLMCQHQLQHDMKTCLWSVLFAGSALCKRGILLGESHPAGRLQQNSQLDATARMRCIVLLAQTKDGGCHLLADGTQIMQGRHPAWGPQQTSQLDDALHAEQQAATPQAAHKQKAVPASPSMQASHVMQFDNIMT